MTISCRKTKCIQCVVMGAVVLGMIFLTAGCGFSNYVKEAPTEEQVEAELEERYGEEFRVITKEKLKAVRDMSELAAYRAYPVDNPELEFNVFFRVFNSNAYSGILPDYRAVLEDYYGHRIVDTEIIHWLDSEGWSYEVEYDSFYIENAGELKEKQYESRSRITIYLEDIETERAIIAKQLQMVLEEIISSNEGKPQIFNGGNYDVYLSLCYMEEDKRRFERITLIQDDDWKPLDISEEGLIREFRE